MSKILEILKAEQARVAENLTVLEPGTEAYSRALEQFSTLKWRIEELEGFTENAPAAPFTPAPVLTPDPTPVPAPVKLDPMEEPTPMAEEPKEEPATEAETETDWDAYRLALRERMADARIGGLDTKALLAKVGAPKFSSIPDEELPALAAALDEALKEKA